MKRKGEADGFGIAVLMILVTAFVCGIISYQKGLQIGRIDIASGRVKATQVVNADGLTEWKFEEAHK